MKRVHLGIVATVLVLTGLVGTYLYRSQHDDSAVAPVVGSDAPGGKEGGAKEDKPPVSRLAQTVQTWPSDKPAVSAPAAEVAAVVAPVEGTAPESAAQEQAAPAPTSEPGPPQAVAAAPEAQAAAAPPQSPDQRDSTRTEAGPQEPSPADQRTVQTALLASGGEHPSAASTAADQAPPKSDETAQAVAAGKKAGRKEGGQKAPSAGAKSLRAEDRPFDAATSWWPAVGNDSASLSLLYAGEAAFDQAIVLLFSKPVSAGTGGKIRLLNGKGKVVVGDWSVSPRNPQMLICKVPSGRYLVSIPAEVADAAGDKLGSSLQGPVYVH